MPKQSQFSPEGGGEAETLAVLQTLHVLEHRVDSLEDTSLHPLEFAEPDGVVHAVVLQEVAVLGHLEGAGAHGGVAVHVGDLAVPGGVVEVGGPGGGEDGGQCEVNEPMCWNRD